jgi:hypothetical protein
VSQVTAIFGRISQLHVAAEFARMSRQIIHLVLPRVLLPLVALLQLPHIPRKVILPTPEQVTGEFPQLPEFAVSGALCRLQLLRLYQEAFLLERLLEFLPLERLPRLALFVSGVQLRRRRNLGRQQEVLAGFGAGEVRSDGVDFLAAGLQESSGAGALRVVDLLLQGFPREELVAAHALVSGAAVVPEVAPGVHRQHLLLLQARLRPSGEFKLTNTDFRGRIGVVLRRDRWNENGGAFPLCGGLVRGGGGVAFCLLFGWAVFSLFGRFRLLSSFRYYLTVLLGLGFGSMHVRLVLLCE